MTIGTKVKHRGINNSWVGVIVGEGRDILGDYWAVKVTSKTNPFYPYGTIDHIGKRSPWLNERAS